MCDFCGAISWLQVIERLLSDMMDEQEGTLATFALRGGRVWPVWRGAPNCPLPMTPDATAPGAPCRRPCVCRPPYAIDMVKVPHEAEHVENMLATNLVRPLPACYTHAVLSQADTDRVNAAAGVSCRASPVKCSGRTYSRQRPPEPLGVCGDRLSCEMHPYD